MWDAELDEIVIRIDSIWYEEVRCAWGCKGDR